jgi:hypothetical protein
MLVMPRTRSTFRVNQLRRVRVRAHFSVAARSVLAMMMTHLQEQKNEQKQAPQLEETSHRW